MKTLLISFFSFLFLISVAQAATVTPFSSPENSYQAMSDYLAGIQESAYMEVYTFTTLEFADRVAEAANRGVDVKVIVDGSPVGQKVNATILCHLEKNNAQVYLHKTGARYMHAKYIVGNNKSAAVTSENFGSDGFHWNRGWGAVIEDSVLANRLAEIFSEDLKNSEEFVCQENVERKISKPPERIELKKYIEPDPQLIVAPDAVEDMVGLINSAQKSLYIEQFYIYKNWKGGANLFLEAAIEKARRGVDVKILLDSSKYNVEPDEPNSNYNTAEYIKGISVSEKIPLDVRLANLDELKLSKVHNKGLIIDNQTVLISSINWNENSPRNNREIGVAITGDSVGYFLGKFLDDWNSGYSQEDYTSSLGGKVVSKDYPGITINIVVFIIVVSIGMLLIKRKLSR